MKEWIDKNRLTQTPRVVFVNSLKLSHTPVKKIVASRQYEDVPTEENYETIDMKKHEKKAHTDDEYER